MPPEQLARGETTIQSDLYSLGLILYEAFTGQQAHKSGSVAELHRSHAASSPRPPAELVADLDPAVERTASRHLGFPGTDCRPAQARVECSSVHRKSWELLPGSLMAKDIESDLPASIWERVIRFEGEPSATAARELMKLQFPENDRKRMLEQVAKARAGTPIATEERETEAYERLGCLLDIIHSQARLALKHQRAAF